MCAYCIYQSDFKISITKFKFKVLHEIIIIKSVFNNNNINHFILGFLSKKLFTLMLVVIKNIQ